LLQPGTISRSLSQVGEAASATGLAGSDALRNQADNTEHGIAPELVQAGIPKSDIVLGFRPLEVPKHAEYAVA
jgi:hypothetical protein